MNSPQPQCSTTAEPRSIGAPLQHSDTLPAEDPAWCLSEPTEGRAPIPPRNEPIIYVRIPRHCGGGETNAEEE